MKRSKLKRVSPSRAVFLVVAVLFLLAIALVCFLPIWHVIMASISNPTQVNVSKGLILSPLGNVDVTAYKMLLSYQSLWTGYRNTIFYIILSLRHHRCAHHYRRVCVFPEPVLLPEHLHADHLLHHAV